MPVTPIIPGEIDEGGNGEPPAVWIRRAIMANLKGEADGVDEAVAIIVRNLAALTAKSSIDFDALARLAEIPPVGSEERERWLEQAKRQVFAVHKGFLCTTAEGFLTLMSEARKQGQRDILGEPPTGPGYPSETTPSGRGAARGYPSRGPLDNIVSAYEARVAAVPEAARRFAAETWGETWAHAEMGSLLDFAALLVPAFATGIPSGGWRPISSAPKDKVILAGKWHGAMWALDTTYWEPAGKPHAEAGWWQMREIPPTHWMPTPPAPSVSDRSGEAVETTGSTEGKSTADLSATPEVNSSPPLPHPRKGQEETPCPMTAEEAREVLKNLSLTQSPQEHVERWRRASLGMTHQKNIDSCLAKADRIELALSTIRASEGAPRE